LFVEWLVLSCFFDLAADVFGFGRFRFQKAALAGNSEKIHGFIEKQAGLFL